MLLSALPECSKLVNTNMIFAIFDSNVHQLGILWFFGRSEDEGRICGCILWLVLSNGSKVARVAHDCGTGGFQLFKRASHDVGLFVRVVVRYVVVGKVELLGKKTRCDPTNDG